MPAAAATLAEAAAAAVGVDYSGVTSWRRGGRLRRARSQFHAGLVRLQTVCETDIAGSVVRGFLTALRAATRPRLVVA